MNFIAEFKKLNKDDADIAGGKGASLGEMTRAGISVPPGFVILSNAFEKFLEESDLNVEIDAVLHSVNHKKIHTVDDASEKIKALILGVKIPKDILDEVKKCFGKLGVKYVAVRSSATAEDSASAAWAGQLESYLNTTEKNLLENIKKCWASLFTPRAIFYRFEKGFHKQKISVAVVVQKMVKSESSGVVFSVHPVTQDKNQLIIEAGLGLGEAIVSGQITPDSYVVEKKPRRIIDKNIYIQKRGLYFSTKQANKWKNIPVRKGKKQVLSDKEILKLSEIILRIENHYGFPCDIEWAFEKGKFYIVQSRPITTLQNIKPIKKAKRVFLKEHSREYSLFRVYILRDILDIFMPEISGGFSSDEVCAVYRGKDLVDIYYEDGYIKKLFTKLTKKVNTDPGYIKKQVEEFLKIFNKLKPYFKGNKKISGKKEFKKIMTLYTKYWANVAIGWVIPMLPGVDEKLKKLTLESRKKTQEYNEAIEPVFKNTLEKWYPYLKNKTRFILPEEVWTNKIEDKEKILKKISERKKGFIFYKNKLYTGDVEKNIKQLGIILDETKSGVSGKTEEKKGKIKGQIAYKGKVKGSVKIVSSIKDLGKVRSKDILVTAMTMPKYLSAMKRASAFITDEGGVTCHAAIIAREMKKPCIIGTKIATQILKDGDLVEVDADKGVVKILNKKDG